MRRGFRRATVALALLALCGCTARPAVRHDDPSFRGPLEVHRVGDRTYLYVPGEDGPAVMGSLRVELAGESVLVYAPLLISGHRPEPQLHELDLPAGLSAEDLDGRIFWVDGDGSRHALPVVRKDGR